MNPWGGLVQAIQGGITWTGGALGIPELAAILLVTAAARAVLLPVSYPLAVRSRAWQLAFRGIRPRIREVRKLHKNDPRTSIDEVDRLHTEAGIGAVDKAGVLLALIQIPILIAFFQAVLDLSGDPPMTASTVFLGIAAGALSLLSTRVGGQTQSRAFHVVSALLPTTIALWLGSGIGAYLVGFYGVTLVQSALVGRLPGVQRTSLVEEGHEVV